MTAGEVERAKFKLEIILKLAKEDIKNRSYGMIAIDGEDCKCLQTAINVLEAILEAET